MSTIIGGSPILFAGVAAPIVARFMQPNYEERPLLNSPDNSNEHTPKWKR